jgi:hypothetical protein
MTPVSRRIAVAVAALATLALAACSVPGQGDPGVAATYGDRVVTNQQVLDMSQAYADLGTAPGGVGEPLTMLLLGPDLIAEAEELGLVVSDAKLQNAAENWIAYNERGGTVTPEALTLVHDLLAVFYLLTSDEGVAVLEQAGIDAEAGVVASPRYGAFTNAAYYATLLNGYNEVTNDSGALGVLLFVPFGQVNGFAGEIPSWISGG